MGAMFIQTPNGAERVGGGCGGGVNVTASVGQTIVVKEVDANGKPTKWEAADYQPRTHWSEVTEILPEITVEIDPDIGMGLIPVDFTVEGGVEYTVKYNGVDYVCAATVLDGAVFMGNVGALGEGFEGLPVTNDPFALVYASLGVDDEDNDIYGWAIIPLDGSASVTVSIAGVKHTPIPVQYMRNALPYYIEITGSGTDEEPYVCNDTVANVEAIIATGRTVCARIRLPGIEQIYYRTLSVVETEYGSSIYFVVALAGTSPFRMMHLVPQSNGLYKGTVRDID